jgi:hypothetical protein
MSSRTCNALPIHSIPIATLGSELLTDPGLETWTSATNLTNYTEEVAGGTTVNQESVSPHGGTYCARIDVVSSNRGDFLQAVSGLTVGKRYRFSWWSKDATTGREGWAFVINSSLSSVLTKDGKWLPYSGFDPLLYPRFTNTTSWVQHSFEFVAPESAVVLGVSSSNLYATQSIYFDDLSLKEITYVSAQPDILALYQPGSPPSVVNPIRSSQQFGPNLFIDGDLDVWSSTTNLTNWIETIGGSGTITQEASVKRPGAYSARIYTDTPGNLTYIYQAVTLAALTAYKWSIWYKTAPGKRAAIYLLDTVNSKYLKADSTWAVPADPIILPEAVDWKKFEIYFSTQTGTVSCTFSFAGVGPYSSDSYTYYDELCIQTVVPVWPPTAYQSGEVISLGSELLTDGGVETWASATDLTDWVEAVFGAATVNREASIIHGGTYSVRIDIAATPTDYAYIRSADITVTPLSRYQLSFWYRTPAGKTAALLMTNTAVTTTLRPSGFIPGSTGFSLPDTNAQWVKYYIEFTAPPVFTTYKIYPGANYLGEGYASSSFYFDDFSLKEVISTPALRPIQSISPGALGTEVLVDPGLEAWSSATDLTNWTETVSGTSTVNRETVSPHGGTYCARLDIDATNHNAYVAQGFSLAANRVYQLSFWYKTTNSKQAAIQLATSGGTHSLKNDGKWGPLTQIIVLPAVATWTKYSLYFRAHLDFTSYTLYWGGGDTFVIDSASASLVFDDWTLKEMLSMPAQEPVGWTFDGSNDFIHLPNDTTIHKLYTNFTFGIWAYAIDTAAYYIALEFGGPSNVNAHIFIDTASAKWAVNFINAAATPQIVLSDVLTVGKWYFIVGTYSDRGRIYINGSYLRDIAITGQLDARIGGYIGIRQGNTLPYKGKLAFPFFAGYAMTAKEITDIFNATKGMFFPK